MKESEKIANECVQLLNKYHDCLNESGFKGRFFCWCCDYKIKFNKCNLRRFEQQRREHVELTLKNKKKNIRNSEDTRN